MERRRGGEEEGWRGGGVERMGRGGWGGKVEWRRTLASWLDFQAQVWELCVNSADQHLNHFAVSQDVDYGVHM